MKQIFIFTLFIFDLVFLYSQNTLKDTVKIEGITIIADKPKPEDKSVIPMQTISRIELDRISGNTVADAIKNFSGIIIKDYGGIGGLKTVMVRSLGANHTGVFVDGVPVSDAATGQVDFGKISTDNAVEISLFVGQANDICQPARYFTSSGVISINSLEPNFGSKKLIYKAGIKTGSFGLLNPVVYFQKKIGTKSYVDASLTYINAGGRYPYFLKYGSLNDTILLRENTDIESININSVFVHHFIDSSKLSLRTYYFNSERGLPGAVVYYNPFSEQRLWNNDFFTNIQYKSNAMKRIQSLTNIKISQHKLRYLDPEYLNMEGKLDNRYRQREYYASQVFVYSIRDSFSISVASDIFINTLTANLYNYAAPTRYSLLSVIVFQYTHQRLETNANVLTTWVSEKTETGKPASDQKKLSPGFSIGYKLTNKQGIRLRFLYKDIFRMPTFNDLYYTLSGNYMLQPEYAKQFNLGITGYSNFGIIDYFSFKSDVFYNKVSDKIVAIPTKNLFVWSMHNIGKVNIKGLELQTRFQTKPVFKNFRFNFSCNYTYQEAIDVTDKISVTYKHQIPYIPFETFSAMSSFNYKKFSLNFNALFNGYRYVLGENIYQNMIPSWWVCDVSAVYDFSFKKYTFKMKGEINNLFDTHYEVIRSFPMPGRSYYFNMTIIY